MGLVFSDVITSLTTARNQLLSESQQAASQGNWGRARTLMELAERADRLREDVSSNAADGQETKGSDVEYLPAINPVAAGLAQRPSTQGRYPKYRVRDDALIKQGLQRSGKDVYEHIVPRERFDEIVTQLAGMAAGRRQMQRPFSVDLVQKQVSCPQYMTYVVISLLMRERLIIRARKGSYRFADSATFRSAAADLWDRLKGEDEQ